MHLINPINEFGPLLGRWVNFYIIMAASAATLIGLLFVVIALAAERRARDADAAAKIRIYLTPTAVYFASVLGIASLLTFPNHTLFTATLSICLLDVAGLVYVGSILVGSDKKSYEDRRDLIPYAGLPCAAYACLVLGGVCLLHDAQWGLTVVAVGMLSLLTVAFRNSWAVVIGVVSTPPGRP
jgi:hypothetical protein